MSGTVASHPAHDRWSLDRLSGWRWQPAALDVVLVGSLLALAVLLRLPNLLVVPRLTDETDEVLLGLRVLRGQVQPLPLVGVNTYIGSLYTYLVAGAFWLLGPRPDAGRLVALVFGALAVIPTYLLGRRLGGAGWRGRAVGAIGALLLACSSADILVTSRIAYSNSLTPFFATAGLWLFHRGVVEQSGRSLVLSGALFGLALQTHASAVATWPALGLYLLLNRRRVRLRWVMLAALVGLLMLVNLLAFNLIHLGATFDEIMLRSGRYGGTVSVGTDTWPQRLGTLLRSGAFALAGLVSEQVEPPEALYSPPVLAYGLLALLGLALLARRREWLPALMVISALLVVSLFNDRVEPVIVRVRHYAQLLPLAFVAVGVAVVALRDRLAALGSALLSRDAARSGSPGPGSPGPGSPGRGLLGPAALATGPALLLVAFLALAPQLALGRYLSERLARPTENNLALLQVGEAIKRGAPNERVYVDVRLVTMRTMSGGRLLRQVEYLLEVQGQEYQRVDLSRQLPPIGTRGVTSRRLVLSADSISAASERYRLVPLPGDPGDGAPVRVFRAYPQAGARARAGP